MDTDRALKEKFCQNISVQYVQGILCDACLKTAIFTAHVSLFCIFLKATIFPKTKLKKLKNFLISRLKSFFWVLNSVLV